MFKIIVLVLSLFIVSCVTISPAINPNSPIKIYGVTALSPQNGEWVVMAASGYQSTLASKGSSKDASLVVNVSIFQLPALDTDQKFLEYIINARASTPNTGRFDNQKYTENLSTLNGAVCVKYHSFSNDNNAKIAGGKASMLLESIGYNCQHPINNLVGVNIEYSSRYFETKEKSSLEKDSKTFFSNIEFSEF